MWAGPWLIGRVREAGASRSQALCLSAWALGLGVYAATRRRGSRSRLVARLAGLGAAGVLALLLSAVQVLPVLDHITASVRWAGGGPEDLYDSSLLPYRAFEWIWPNVSGTFTAGNRYWITILPPTGAHWPSPLSLYAGALPIVLAMGAAGFRGGPPWRAWMTAVALLSFWASVGAFAGPASWAAAQPSPEAGDDSLYGLLTIVLPALRLFRFPFKLLPFTAVGLSALAGLGWDRVSSGFGRRKTVTLAVVLLLPTLLCLAAAAGMQRTLADAIARRASSHLVFGPIDPVGAAGAIMRGLAHGAVALASGVAVLAWSAGRRRAVAAAIAMALIVVDLAVANAPLVFAIPQADFEREPEALRAIREAERERPQPGSVPDPSDALLGPGRLGRIPVDATAAGAGQLGDRHAPARLRLAAWPPLRLRGRERDRPRRPRRLFQPASRVLDAGLSAALEIEPDRRVLYHARGAFDLWVRRYFIIPAHPGSWTRAERSSAAFVDETDLIYPSPASLEDPGRVGDRQRWILTHDVLVRRNRRAFPRAWIVHDARLIPPIVGADPAPRDALTARLLAADASLRPRTPDPGPDLRRTAYVETDDPASLAAYLQPDDPSFEGTSSPPAEVVSVTEEAPTRVRIEATLRRPGIIVLADAFDSGWRLTVDGRPAPILRANLLMRAAAVGAGRHTLLYRYDPASVRIGAWISLAGLLSLVGAAYRARIRDRLEGLEAASSARASGTSPGAAR